MELAMKYGKQGVLAVVVLALAAASTTAVAGAVWVDTYDPASNTTTSTLYNCANTCMVFSDGRTKWVEDSRGGYVDIVKTNVYLHTDTHPIEL